MDSIKVAEVTSYGMDLGNGFAKRITAATCFVEPAVLAKTATYFAQDSDVTVLEMENEAYFIGDDVNKLGLKAQSATGEHDLARYETPEFKKLFFGFIAKDFKRDIVIDKLVTGLPVQHYKSKCNTLIELLKGKTVVKVNGVDIIITINNVIVLPQPIGTYMHLVSTKQVVPGIETTLIVDNGHGTLDITELKGKTIVKRAGNNEGAKTAYIDIYNYLVGEYGALNSITINNVPNLLAKGLKVDGSVIAVGNLKEVRDILRAHFESMFTFLQDNSFDLRLYDKVVFTGGVAHLYKDMLMERTNKNFVILENGQTANARGYHEYGKMLGVGVK